MTRLDSSGPDHATSVGDSSPGIAYDVLRSGTLPLVAFGGLTAVWLFNLLSSAPGAGEAASSASVLAEKKREIQQLFELVSFERVRARSSEGAVGPSEFAQGLLDRMRVAAKAEVQAHLRAGREVSGLSNGRLVTLSPEE